MTAGVTANFSRGSSGCSNHCFRCMVCTWRIPRHHDRDATCYCERSEHIPATSERSEETTLRAPNAEQIKEECLDMVPSLLNAHGLRCRNPELEDEGWVNVCILTKDVVVRVNARDPDLPKFQREAVAFGLAAEAGIPVPEVVVLDTSKELLPWDVLVTNRLEGVNGERSWPSLPRRAREQLAFEAGKYLAMLHQIRMPHFGEISGEEGLPTADSWPAAVRAILTWHLDAAVECGALEDADAAEARDLGQRASARLSDEATPRLLHNDLHLGNVLHVNGQVTAVLDFEWAMAGAPAFDFIGMPWVEKACPGAGVHYRGGYRSVRTPGEARTKRPGSGESALYHLIGAAELLSVGKRFLSEREARDYRIRYDEAMRDLAEEL